MARLNRAAINFLVDCLLLVVLVSVLALSAMVEFVFPSGTKAAGWALWGLGYDGWSRVRAAALGFFVLCVLLHLILHWTWICGFVVSRFARRPGQSTKLPPDGIRTLYGVSLLIGILTLICTFVGIAKFAVVAP